VTRRPSDTLRDTVQITSASKHRPAPHSALVELRQYELRPGQRDVLVELFERELLEPQARTGMSVIGQFADRDDPNRFVWLRGFADMPSRRAALSAFYEGPVWRAHRSAANATIVGSDNVLLLRPARSGAGFALDDERPDGSRGVVAATLVHLETANTETAIVEVFESTIAAAIGRHGGQVLGYFVTEPSRNDYPVLPVREGESVVVWFAGFTAASALEAAAAPTRGAVDAALGRLSSIRRVEKLVLLPTRRSLLTGRASPCRAFTTHVTRAQRAPERTNE